MLRLPAIDVQRLGAVVRKNTEPPAGLSWLLDERPEDGIGPGPVDEFVIVPTTVARYRQIANIRPLTVVGLQSVLYGLVTQRARSHRSTRR